ncbi:hypothetical protein HMI54_013495, partial [Coelomomyces lativittatus]
MCCTCSCGGGAGAFVRVVGGEAHPAGHAFVPRPRRPHPARVRAACPHHLPPSPRLPRRPTKGYTGLFGAAFRFSELFQ